MRRGISYALIVLGVLVLLYPKAREWQETRQQEKLLREWEAASYEETAEDAAQLQYELLTDLFGEEQVRLAAADETESAGLSAAPDETEVEESTVALDDAESSPSSSNEAEGESAEAPSLAPKAAPAPAKLNPIATIKIDKIKLKLPVVEGATQKNMKSAAAHLTETAALGQVGNAAIAGHRMRSKGRLFNRLGELEIGDKIVVETKKQSYTYTVYKVSVVEPTDVSVLNYNDKDKLLTLITCEPIVNPTHRLIIHAKL